jgi:hypothetical protein
MKKTANEEFHKLYASPNIIRVKSTKMMWTWAEHAELTGEMRCAYKTFKENSKGRDHLGQPGTDMRIIIKWIYKNWV